MLDRHQPHRFEEMPIASKPQHDLDDRNHPGRAKGFGTSTWHDAPRRFIDPTAEVHETSTVWHFARVLAEVVIGAHCSIGGGAEVGRGSRIGDYSRVSANVFLPSNSVVGEHVFIGPGVVCTDDRYPRTLEPGESYEALPPVIGDYASIGAGAILLPGVRIGRRARIAAGAIVTRDVPDEGMVRGEPARTAKRSVAAQTW